jgi:hypothetical protein
MVEAAVTDQRESLIAALRVALKNNAPPTPALLREVIKTLEGFQVEVEEAINRAELAEMRTAGPCPDDNIPF